MEINHALINTAIAEICDGMEEIIQSIRIYEVMGGGRTNPAHVPARSPHSPPIPQPQSSWRTDCLLLGFTWSISCIQAVG